MPADLSIVDITLYLQHILTPCLTWKRASSKSRTGPVVPTMIRGWQENRANVMPQKAVEMMVSEMPICSFVLSTAGGKGQATEV